MQSRTAKLSKEAIFIGSDHIEDKGSGHSIASLANSRCILNFSDGHIGDDDNHAMPATEWRINCPLQSSGLLGCGLAKFGDELCGWLEILSQETGRCMNYLST